MNEFILSAREDALGTLKKLFQLTLLKNSLIAFLCQIILFASILPILMYVLGTNFETLISLQENMQTYPLSPGDNIEQYFLEFFPNANFMYMIPLIFIYMLFFSWNYAFILSNNDFYIKHLTQNIGDAFKRSLSKITLNVFVSLILTTVYLALLFIATFGIISMIALASQVAAGIVGFFLFIITILISIKTVYILPAIVHGNLNFFTAFGQSWKIITLKRSAKFIVVGLTIGILFFLVSLFASVISIPFENMLKSNHTAHFIVNQLISIVLNVVLANLMYAGLSTLYFRYCDVELEMNQSEHLVD